MVLQADPIAGAIRFADLAQTARVILTCPQGKVFDQQLAWELAQENHLVIVCGHYEGVDERIRETLVTDEISIGDFVLTGGEIPALVLADAIIRLLPGTLGAEDAALDGSFSTQPLGVSAYQARVWEGRGCRQYFCLVITKKSGWRRRESLARILRPGSVSPSRTGSRGSETAGRK